MRKKEYKIVNDVVKGGNGITASLLMFNEFTVKPVKRCNRYRHGYNTDSKAKPNLQNWVIK
jgi:hypothetical protein